MALSTGQIEGLLLGRTRRSIGILVATVMWQPGSASIPKASISYRYRIVLVSIARIDIESIRYRFLTAFYPAPS